VAELVYMAERSSVATTPLRSGDPNEKSRSMTATALKRSRHLASSGPAKGRNQRNRTNPTFLPSARILRTATFAGVDSVPMPTSMTSAPSVTRLHVFPNAPLQLFGDLLVDLDPRDRLELDFHQWFNISHYIGPMTDQPQLPHYRRSVTAVTVARCLSVTAITIIWRRAPQSVKERQAAFCIRPWRASRSRGQAVHRLHRLDGREQGWKSLGVAVSDE
jgi:hypothetical protein